MDHRYQERATAYGMGVENKEKSNQLDLHLYKDGEGWTYITKKASDQAEYKQLADAMRQLAKKAKKDGYKCRINMWYKSKLVLAHVCKEWSM